MISSNVIRDIHTRWLRMPFPTAISDSTHTLKYLDLILVEVESEAARGTCYMLSFDYAPRLLKAFIDQELKPHVLGLAADDIRAVYERMMQCCEYVGQSGLAMWGIAALDTALWDLLACRLDVPASLLFGRYSNTVPVYGSGGWVSYSDEELSDEIARYIERGLKAVKIKIGGPSEDWDVARVRALRSAVGPEIGIRVDANQALTVERTLRTAQRLQDCRLDWIEEPLPRADLHGYARLTATLDVPIAAGEREFGVEPFQRMMDSRAISIVQPDLLRVGGVTGWRQVAMLAESHHLRLAPHFYKEYDVHLAACCPGLIGIECFDWLDPLLVHPLEIRDGMAVVPDRPGFGVAFRPEAIREYEVQT